MLHGLANGVFLDEERFWPIYARAEKLDLPIYLHPSLPQADVIFSFGYFSNTPERTSRIASVAVSTV
jgi:predicted TIM-barrel fold metal-dependent hydrolase